MNALRDSDTHPKGGDALAAPFMGSAGCKASPTPCTPNPTDDGIPAFDPVELRRYFADPHHRARIEAETARRRALANAVIDRGVRANHPHISQGERP